MKHFFVIFFLAIFIQSVHAQWSLLETDDSKDDKAPHLGQYFTTKDWNSSNFASEEDMEWSLQKMISHLTMEF